MRQHPRRVVILEPQQLFLPHIVEALTADGLNVIATLATFDEEELTALKPDVLLVDLGISTSAAFSSLSKIRRAVPKARLIVFGGLPNPTWRASAWMHGVDEVLTDRDGIVDLLAAAHAPIIEPPHSPW